jgi:hypothetical protein
VRIPARWFVEPVTIEPYAGQGAYGDVYAAPVTVLGHISGGRRVQGTVAQEVVSERRLMLPNPTHLADGSGTVDPVAVLTPESRITAGAVVATVGEVTPHIQPGTGAVVYVSGSLG